MVSTEPMTAPDNTILRRFYHGTRADLKPGDLIAAGYGSNYGAQKQASWVYLTGTLDAAIWGAELAAGDGPERIYIVEPTGPIEDDPQSDGQEIPGQSDAILSLPRADQGHGRGHGGHSPERLKEMKDHLGRLKAQGVEAID